MMPDIRNESAALKEMPRGYLEYLKKVEPYLRNQSEDCLYLNIYSPIGKWTHVYSKKFLLCMQSKLCNPKTYSGPL